MKKISFFLFPFLIVLGACTQSQYWKLKIEIPRVSPLNMDPYEKILITSFLVENETGGFDISSEIVDYLNFELSQKLEKEILSAAISPAKEENFDEEEFWKNIGRNHPGVLFLTGRATYSEETRKALIKQETRRYEEPLSSKVQLAQRKFYTLHLDLYFIEGETGKIVLTKNFQETKNYKNPNQTAYFAFYDLMQTVKTKLFRTLLGEESVQERYLISS